MALVAKRRVLRAQPRQRALDLALLRLGKRDNSDALPCVARKQFSNDDFDAATVALREFARARPGIVLQEIGRLR